jgi:hypothetical protein
MTDLIFRVVPPYEADSTRMMLRIAFSAESTPSRSKPRNRSL